MNAYLKKHAFCDQLIDTKPSTELGLVVVIPCLREPQLLETLKSLTLCTSPTFAIEVIIVINQSEDADQETIEANNKSLKDARLFAEQNNTKQRSFYPLSIELPTKHAGVGLARKIGMDEAVRRFDSINMEGIIVNLDADCTVSENYFTEIETHFEKGNKAASFYFEHPLDGLSEDVTNAIISYELFLRYYINMQRLIAYPWAYQTIGSAMAVTSDLYQQQGGMNRRKAGEDFYFMQKFIELGRCDELNQLTVFASSRKSDRVPFGTGKAITDICEGHEIQSFYHPESFHHLSEIYSFLPTFYVANESQIAMLFSTLDKSLSSFLEANNWAEKLLEIKAKTVDYASFRKRFFRSFNAFQLMKFMHWSRDQYYPDLNSEEAMTYLFDRLNLGYSDDQKSNLLALRSFDRSNDFSISL